MLERKRSERFVGRKKKHCFFFSFTGQAHVNMHTQKKDLDRCLRLIEYVAVLKFSNVTSFLQNGSYKNAILQKQNQGEKKATYENHVCCATRA